MVDANHQAIRIEINSEPMAAIHRRGSDSRQALVSDCSGATTATLKGSVPAKVRLSKTGTTVKTWSPVGVERVPWATYGRRPVAPGSGKVRPSKLFESVSWRTVP